MNSLEQARLGPGRRRLPHVVAEAREQLGGDRGRAHALRRDGRVDRRSRRDRDAQRPSGFRELCRERPLGRRRPPRIARLVARDDVEEGGRVCDRTRHRPGGGETFERAERRVRDPTAGGLQPEESAARRRDPDRASTVRGVRDRHEPGGDGCGRTPARPARREVGVPGVPRRSVEIRLRERDGAELRRVGLADDDEPGLADASHDGGVEVGDVLGIGPGRVRRADPGRRGEILHTDRNAAKRRVAGSRVDVRCRGERLLAADRDERVQRRIELVDAGERELDELRRRDLTLADQPRLLERREERELHPATLAVRSGRFAGSGEGRT